MVPFRTISRVAGTSSNEMTVIFLPEAELIDSVGQVYFLAGGGNVAFDLPPLAGLQSAALFFRIPAAGVAAKAAVHSGVEHLFLVSIKARAEVNTGSVQAAFDVV